jgi:hypothetical protein
MRGEDKMKHLSSLYLSFLFILSTSMITNSQPSESLTSPDLDTLASWMSGYFSSQKQSLQDTSYRDVRLHMFPIWKARDDGYWFYVEQAVAEYAGRPYRQRIYNLYQASDTTFYSEVYTLSDPAAFTGAWKKERSLPEISRDSLELRTGCTTILRRSSASAFSGGTQGRGCESNLRGASYATSQVVIQRDKLISWDRGFDAEGKQVWGAEKGGYVFRKIESY